VTLNDDRTYGATVVGTDPSTDLAVINLTNAPRDLKPIALGTPTSSRLVTRLWLLGTRWVWPAR